MIILIQLHKLFVIFDDNQQLSSNGTTIKFKHHRFGRNKT